MDPQTVGIASASLIAGWAIGGLAMRLAIRAARALVKRTKTPKDDLILAAVEKYLEDHPEDAAALLAFINRKL